MKVSRARALLIGLGTALLLAVSGSETALATPITYTETATVGGFLGGVQFSPTVMTLTGSGDTANITDTSGFFQNFLTVSFSLAGVTGGSGTFSNQTFVFSQQNDPIGIGGFSDNVLNAAILTTTNAAFKTYALSTGISVSGPGTVIQNGFSFPTSAGSLVFNFLSPTIPATFTATPLPTALPLFATGLGAVCLVGVGNGKRSLRFSVPHSHKKAA